ncbi:MAG TPA: Clp protease N-terminal domain-containing protein, partial [Acidimicrobiales bacterium]|nr:Clp protease N-terminal domain-containing protein [Acidimicrobiales bacterium]
MFERFTKKSREVLVLAQKEAQLCGHGFLGTEHILLGLIALGEGVGAAALSALGVSLDDVRAE